MHRILRTLLYEYHAIFPTRKINISARFQFCISRKTLFTKLFAGEDDFLYRGTWLHAKMISHLGLICTPYLLQYYWFFDLLRVTAGWATIRRAVRHPSWLKISCHGWPCFQSGNSLYSYTFFAWCLSMASMYLYYTYLPITMVYKINKHILTNIDTPFHVLWCINNPPIRMQFWILYFPKIILYIMFAIHTI